MTSTFRIGLAGLAASAFLMLATPVRGAQEVPENLKGKATISGKVVDDLGKSVPNPKVTLILVENNASLIVQGKGNGDFEAKNIKPGAWRMVIETPNYVTVRQDVTVADGKNPKMSAVSKRDFSPELLEAADALAKAGQLAEARTEYLKVLEAHPELTAINRFIAFTYGRERNTAEALKYLDLALAGNPNDTVMLQLAATSAIELNQVPRAMGYLEKIDLATVTEPEPYVNMAISIINVKRQAEAIAFLDRLVSQFPDRPPLYFYRGYAKMGLQKPEEAKSDFEKYLALAPTGPQAAQAKEILGSIK